MLSRKLLPALIAAMAPVPIVTPYVDDVFSIYTYTGNGTTQVINNGIDLTDKLGTVDQIEYTVPGTYQFIVPDGVYSISVALAGGGGGSGGNNTYQNLAAGPGGGAGALYKNNIAVTPGQVITVIVGAGGYKGNYGNPASDGSPGGLSSLLGLTANGGNGGRASSTTDYGAAGTGGTASGAGAVTYTGTSGITGSNTVGTISIPNTAYFSNIWAGSGGRSGTMSTNTAGYNGCVRIIWPGTTRQFLSSSSNVTPVGRITGGGLVWTKSRNNTAAHSLTDTVRGITKALCSNTTAAEVIDATRITAVSDKSYTIGASTLLNQNTIKYVSWAFKKSTKFFDIVTYTGDSLSNHAIPHSLGIVPGMVVIKNLASSSWAVWHRSIPTQYLTLNGNTQSVAASDQWGTMQFSDTAFYVGGNSTEWNTSGNQYVAYVFAHDVASDGIIQCGTFTTDASGNASIDLGWEAQFIMLKAKSTSGNWIMMDQARGWIATPSSDTVSFANLGGTETLSANYGRPTSNGFNAAGLGNNVQYMYLAIRRSNKPPTKGTDVYNAITRVGTATAVAITGVGFAPDAMISKSRSKIASANGYTHWWDRLRGPLRSLTTVDTSTELTTDATVMNSFDQDGITIGTNGSSFLNNSGVPYIFHFFKRAVGVFDIVDYNIVAQTGTINIKHNLGVKPELIINKARNSNSLSWTARFDFNTGARQYAVPNTISAGGSIASPGTPIVTADTFSFTNRDANFYQTSTEFISYLFASKAGVSKVGLYNGDGQGGYYSQLIECGFSTGPRYIMIKCISSSSSYWFVWDSVRGMTSSSDLSVDWSTYDGDWTSDSIEPSNSGFYVKQNSGCSINNSGDTYLFLAFS